jgi:hypothetical protein
MIILVSTTEQAIGNVSKKNIDFTELRFFCNSIGTPFLMLRALQNPTARNPPNSPTTPSNLLSPNPKTTKKKFALKALFPGNVM